MRKSMRVPALIMALVMALALVPTARAYANPATTPISVTVNGQLVNFDGQPPIMVDNRVLVPVRGVFELMGFTVTWDAAQRIARLTRSDITVVIPADSTSFVVNNQIVTPEVPQRMQGGRLLLPLRAVAEAVGGVPHWDANLRRANIVTAAAPSPSPTPGPHATPVPLTVAVPRHEGTVGFGHGGNAYIAGIRHANSVWGGGWAHYNLNRRFMTLTGTIGRLDGSGSAARTIRIIGDGQEIYSRTVSGYTPVPHNLVVDIHNITILRIEIDDPGNDGVSIALGNPTVHASRATAPTPSPRPSPGPAATPGPLLTVAPRTDGSPGFATGAGINAYIHGIRHTGAIVGGGWSTHNLNNRFATLTGVIGRQDGFYGRTETRTIRFIGDGRVLNSFTVGVQGHATPISVDVRNVNVLRIEIDHAGTNGVSIVFGNTMLQPTVGPSPGPGATPAPLLTVAPRADGSPGFATGTGANALMNGQTFPGSIWGGGWSTHHLNRRFTTLTATIGRLDNVSGTAMRTISFIGDNNRPLGTFHVYGNSAPRTISVDVRDVTWLRIDIQAQGVDGVTVVATNMVVHHTHVVPSPSPTPATTPAPLVVAAPRFEGDVHQPSFGVAGRHAYMLGHRYNNSIFGGGWSNHNLDRRFHTLTAYIGRQDGSGVDRRDIRIFGDGQLLPMGSHHVIGDHFAPFRIEVDVRNIIVLRIEIDHPGTGGAVLVLGNPTLHPTAVTSPTPTPGPLTQVVTRTGGEGNFGFGQTITLGGVTHQNSFSGGGWSTHALNRNYTTLTATLGRIDGFGTARRYVRFFRDNENEPFAIFPVYGAAFTPRQISVSVHNVNTLRVQIDGAGADGVTIGLGNPWLNR